MDEATASVDNETDGIIQKLISTAFQDKTVITIAHRLETIMGSNIVLVMDSGKVVEMGAPVDLLKDKNGYFSNLVEKTGKENAEKLKSMVENYGSDNNFII